MNSHRDRLKSAKRKMPLSLYCVLRLYLVFERRHNMVDAIEREAEYHQKLRLSKGERAAKADASRSFSIHGYGCIRGAIRIVNPLALDENLNKLTKFLRDRRIDQELEEDFEIKERNPEEKK